jgi:hypothetical protein
MEKVEERDPLILRGRYRNLPYIWGLARNFMFFWDIPGFNEDIFE